jgi:stage III sporulation protein SpoIIIAA
MSLPIISAQQRLAERKGVKLLMLGKSGIGKTTRLKDLDPPPPVPRHRGG